MIWRIFRSHIRWHHDDQITQSYSSSHDHITRTQLLDVRYSGYDCIRTVYMLNGSTPTLFCVYRDKRRRRGKSKVLWHSLACIDMVILCITWNEVYVWFLPQVRRLFQCVMCTTHTSISSFYHNHSYQFTRLKYLKAVREIFESHTRSSFSTSALDSFKIHPEEETGAGKEDFDYHKRANTERNNNDMFESAFSPSGESI